MRLMAILAVTLVMALSGCYHSGSRQQDGWDTEQDLSEPEQDVAQEEPDIQPEIAVCGNGIVEPGEACEVSDLGGETCESLGLSGDGLTCDDSCRFDASECLGCGNGTCDLGENSSGCPADCHDLCGNGACEEEEDQFGCPADCGAVAISAGGFHSCAVLVDGTVRCWGSDGNGELGYDPGTLPHEPPVAVPDVAGAVTISSGRTYDCGGWDPGYCGGGYTCAAVEGETIWCWSILMGCCDRWAPAIVSGLSGAGAVSVGTDHACALLVDGTSACWGANPYGELGDGSTTETCDPVAVSGLARAVAVSVSGRHSCALLDDGSVRCWGRNDAGQLGDGTTENSPLPVEVAGLTSAVAIATGGYGSEKYFAGIFHSCAVLSDGTVRCWGANDAGQLGDGETHDTCDPMPMSTREPIDCSVVPVMVPGLAGVVGISAGSEETCAVLSGGGVSCWGGSYGATPTAVPGLAVATQVSVGGDHVCIVSNDGGAWCWGDNSSGQLGVGTIEASDVPVAVAPW